MSSAYETPADDALRKDGVIVERLRSAKRTAIANVMGKSDSWVDKVLNGEQGVMLSDLSLLLAAVDLKAVDKQKVCVDKDIYIGLWNISGAALTEPKKLEWE